LRLDHWKLGIHHMRRLLLLTSILIAGSLGGWLLYDRPVPQPAQAEAGPIPVVVAIAATEDVPFTVNGIGNVQAFNTVTVRTRVDGELQQVAFREGQDMNAGDLLAQIDPRPYQAQVDQYEAQLQKDRATLENAKRDLVRYQTVGTLASTQQQIDTQSSLVDQLTGAIGTDQAQIDYAQTQLGYTRITTPFSGRVGVRLVDQGNIVHAADAGGIVILTQLQPISVLFTVPESSFDDLRRASALAGEEGLMVNVSVPSDLVPRASGKLAVINNQIDVATGTLQLKATFQNEDRALWPGQFVRAKVVLRTVKASTTVPSAAIQRGSDGLNVYVVSSDLKAQLRKVKVAFSFGERALISEGVNPGDKVVIDGQFKLKPGTAVTLASEPKLLTQANP
jgi:membrane fusion protein, multidrug efflux system